MSIITATLLFVLTVQTCQCHEFWYTFIPNLYMYRAHNRALQNHVFQWKTEPSYVICGRDCSMDPQCASFNYHPSSQICELNNATRSQSPCDFIQLQGSFYFDDIFGTSLSSVPYRCSSCQMLLRAGHHDNGIYTICPTMMTDGLQVYCDMQTDGGGWIVFQRRQDGSVNFYRDWAEYKSGFGDVSGEFWLGNDILRTLTEQGTWQLRVELKDWNGSQAFAKYGEFGISGQKYTILVGLYNASSTAGNSMENQNGRPFTTRDQDNDNESDNNCAVLYEGAWWFNECHASHLNGEYFYQEQVPYAQGVHWYHWKGDYKCLKYSSMKIREVL